MPKQLLIGFFAFLLIIPASVFFIAETNKTSTPSNIATVHTPSPSPILPETTLTLNPQPFILSSSSGSLTVDIDTQNSVTGVQGELSYDPTMLTILDIIPGNFFANPSVLIKDIDAENGKISFALALPPTTKAQTGKGTIATIMFTSALQQSGKTTTISFLPETVVTAEGITTSVLKNTQNITITYLQEAN